MVVSSYGSMLALPDLPNEVMENLKLLEQDNVLGKYGLYEAIDYTPIRQKNGEKSSVVKTYMAHHQGLILASINNLFKDNILQKRFMKNPEIEAVDILLQERMPTNAILTKEKKEKVEKIKQTKQDSYGGRIYTKIEENKINVNVIANDNYTICMDQNGKGFSKYKNILVNRFKQTADYEQGIFFYIKNIKSKRIWSLARLKFLNKPDKYKISFFPDSNQIDRIDGNIQSKMKVTVTPNEPVEIRTIQLSNLGNQEEVLEVSAYLEPVLSTMTQDYAHPIFNNLFLNFEYIQELNTILVRRKKRGIQEKDMYLAINLNSREYLIGDIEYEIDKAKLNGRGNINVPNMIANSKPFSNQTGSNTEPVVAIRASVKIAPKAQTNLNLILAVSESKEEVLQLVEKYKSEEGIKQVFELSRARLEAENRYLEISMENEQTYQKLLGYLLFQNHLKSLYVKKLPKEQYIQDNLWKYRNIRRQSNDFSKN